MASVRVTDRRLKEAYQALATAQVAGDSTQQAKQRIADRSDEIQREEAARAKRRIFWVNLVSAVVGLIALILIFVYLDPLSAATKHTQKALCWTALAIYVFYGGLGAIRWGEGGLLSFIRGKDGRLATSLLQVALWTVAISAALLYFIFLALYSAHPADTFSKALGGGNLPEAYLLLLGGPFAAAVVARLTVGSKVADQELQKVEGNAKLLDVVADDDEQANLVDAQFLVFNLVALTWFFGALIATPTRLPTIPDLLVGLTSTSAIAYMGAKGVASNRPTVTSVTRHGGTGPVRPGDLVEISGTNFVPAGSTEALVRKIVVKFGEVHASPRIQIDGSGDLKSPSDDSVIAKVPNMVDPGTVQVSVVTAAGIESDPRELVIVADKPVVTGVPPGGAKAGKTIKIHGRLFRSPGAGPNDHPSARFGTTIVEGRILSGELSVKVPDYLKKGTVELVVRGAGGTAWSDPVSLTIK
jgi:hypothetical protein